MGDPLDDALRRGARRYSAGADAEPAATTEVGGGLPEVRARSARRRRTRHAVTSGLGVVVAVAVGAAALNLRPASTERLDIGDHDTPSVAVDEPAAPGTTTAGPAPTGLVPESAPAPAGTTLPTVPGVPAPTTPDRAGGASPSSTTTVPGPGRIKPLHADMTGLGTASFGDDADTAVAALSLAFAKQPDRRTPLPGNACGVRAKLEVAWGAVTVTMLDKGDGLRLASYHWGDLATRNATASHPRPSPAQPTLWNTWGLLVGDTTVPPGAADLVAKLARDANDVSLINAPPFVDPAIVGTANCHRLNVGLHPVADGYVVERLWVFDPVEPTC